MQIKKKKKKKRLFLSYLEYCTCFVLFQVWCTWLHWVIDSLVLADVRIEWQLLSWPEELGGACSGNKSEQHVIRQWCWIGYFSATQFAFAPARNWVFRDAHSSLPCEEKIFLFLIWNEVCTSSGLYWEESKLSLILRKDLKTWVSVWGLKSLKVKV